MCGGKSNVVCVCEGERQRGSVWRYKCGEKAVCWGKSSVVDVV